MGKYQADLTPGAESYLLHSTALGGEKPEPDRLSTTCKTPEDERSTEERSQALAEWSC